MYSSKALGPCSGAIQNLVPKVLLNKKYNGWIHENLKWNMFHVKSFDNF